MDLRKATAEAVKIKGLDIINNLTFINILNDFGAFKGNPSYKPIIKALIEKHFFRNILNNNLNDKERELDVFIHFTGFDKDKVNFIVNEIQLGSSLTNLKGNLQNEENEGFDLKEVYCVKKDGKWGYIDLNGEVIVPIIYTGLSKITDRGIYVAAKYKRNLNRHNERLYNYEFKFFYDKKYICDFPGGEIEKIENESQVNCNMLTSKFEINDHSHYLIPDKWQLYSIYSEEPLSDEYADIETCVDWKSNISNIWETVRFSSQKRKRGLISNSGKEILSNKYEKIVVWNGYIRAYENNPYRIENKRQTIYLFKLNGELVNTFFEEDIFVFNDSIYSFCLNNKWGLKNFSNNVLIPPIYDTLMKTPSGDLFIAGIEISARRPLPPHERTMKFNLINIENKILTKNDYNDISEIFSTKFNHIFLGWWKEGGIEIFNEEGKILIKKEVTYLENSNSFRYALINDKEYLALNCKNDAKENGFFIFNEDGKVILDFSLGQVVDINSEGFIFKRENNKFCYSLINNRIESNENSIIFSYMGRFGIKNDSGSIIINPIYDKIKQLNESCIDIDLSKNIYICKKEGKWGVLNHSNKIIIPFKYDSIEFSISKMGIYFIVSCNQKYGVLNKSGLITIPIIYDVIRPLQTFKI